MIREEETLEVHRLVIGRDEAELEAQGTISEYLIERATFFGNKLGRNKKHVKDFDIVEDPLSGGWIVICMCERIW
jgi:hypothetical protein